MSRTTPPKTYYAWMDTLRGFAIVLVICGHQKPGLELTNYLQAVMLAIFIFASGFLFSGDRYPTAGAYFKKRARVLLIPYLWFTLFSFIFWIVYVGGFKALGSALGPEMLPNVDQAITLEGARGIAGQAKPGIGIVLAAFVLPMLYGSSSLMWYNIPLWFFPGLFVIDGIFYWLQKNSGSDRSLLIWLIVFSVFGYLMGRAGLRLPWNIDTAFSVVFYYGLGYLFRKRYGEGWPMPVAVKALVTVLALAVSIVVIHLNFGSHPSFNQLGKYFLYHLGAIASVIAFMLTAQMLVKLKTPADAAPSLSAIRRWWRRALDAIPRMFDFIGNNAVVYVGAQVMTMGLFMTFNRFALGILPKEKLPSTPWAMYFGLGAMILLVPVAYAVNRWMPFILGRKKAKPKAAPAGEAAASK
ncbi:MAG: acyltransferase family protein [Candidatus Lernaella stagnicola]|nr:acyltransferase family protein [Candidatus Lernaella stagnicola]